MPIIRKERWIEHYSSSQKILLVGEGDFSFSACLARAFGSANNMVATCLHDEDSQYSKHWTSKAHIEELERQKCLVLHEIDVKYMNEHPTLKEMKFDRIIFNFPHAGHFSWLCERDDDLIQKHKDLLRAYFKSAREMVSNGGEIHVTHRDDEPYNKWEVEKLATNVGLQLKEKVRFFQDSYPGYHNKRGGDSNSNKKFPIIESYTYKFTLPNADDIVYPLTMSFEELMFPASSQRMILS